MNKKNGSFIYFLLGIYTLMVSWYFNHSILLLILHYIFWPVYLIYVILSGQLDNDMWKIIPQSYFK